MLIVIDTVCLAHVLILAHEGVRDFFFFFLDAAQVCVVICFFACGMM